MVDFSINNNASAQVALQTLNATQSQLSNVENAVSTGKSVSTSANNAAYFGIAEQMSGNVSGQSAVNAGLSFASQIVTASNNAATQIISILKDIQADVTQLQNNSTGKPSASMSQLDQGITSYIQQIDTIARNATINGVNLLSGGTDDGLNISGNTLTYVTSLQGGTATLSSFNGVLYKDLTTQTSAGNLSVTGGTYTQGTTMAQVLGLAPAGSATAATGTGGTTGAAGAAAVAMNMGVGPGSNDTSNVFVTNGTMNYMAFGGTSTDESKGFQNMIKLVQNAITAMTNVTGALGAAENNIQNMSTYGESVTTDLNNGISALTDANMAQESAKLTSLQTKQQLAIKALTIANGQSQNILALYQ